MYKDFARIVAIVQSISVSIPSKKDFLYLGCVAIIYFFVARLSLTLVLEPEGIAAIWPPSGIFLASLLLCRRELRPWLAGVLFATDLVAEVFAGTPLNVSIIYALALMGDAVLGAWLLLRFVGEPITFTKIRDVLGFLILVVICSNAIMSLLAATGSMLLPETHFWNSFRWWMISDGIGNLLLTPFVVGWFYRVKSGLGSWNPKRITEGALLGFVLVFTSHMAFIHLPENGQFSLLATYFILPPLMWAALRFGLCGVTFSLLTLAVFAVRYAISGQGIEVQLYDVRLDALIVMQLYLAVMAVPTLFLTAVMSQYQREESAARESEARLRLAVSASNVGLWDWDLHANTVYFSPEWKSQIGYRDDEINNNFDEWERRVHPDDLEPTLRKVREFLANPQGRHETEFRFRHKDGSYRRIYTQADLLFDKAGQPARMLGCHIDITERVQAESALRNSEQRFHRALENIPDVIVIYDRDLRIQYINESTRRVTGRPTSDFIGRKDPEVWPPEIYQTYLPTLKESLETRTIRSLESRFDFPVGDQRILLITCVPVLDEDGDILEVIGITHDMTEIKQTEAALLDAKEFAENLIRTANLIFVRLDHSGNVLQMNKVAEKITGYHQAEMLGRNWFETLAPKRRYPYVWEEFEHIVASGNVPDVFENPILTRNGEERQIIWKNNTVSEGSKVIGTISFGMDITERKQAETALKQREAQLRLVTNHAPVLIAHCGYDRRYKFVNQPYADMFGLSVEEIVGRHVREMLGDAAYADANPHMEAVLAGNANEYDLELPTTAGMRKVVHVSYAPECDAAGRVVGFIAAISDITERRHAELALRESEEKFANAFHVSPAALSITRIADGKFLDINEAFLRLFEFDRAEVIGHTSTELNMLTPEERAPLIAAQLATGGLRNAELLAHAKSGKAVNLMFSSKPMKLSGEPCHITVMIDITERKQAEEERQRFVMLADSSSEFIGMCDLELNPLYVNPAGVRMVGLADREAACRVKVQDYFFPEDQPFIQEEFFPRVLREGHGTVEIRLRHFQTGEPIWMSYYLFHVHDASGAVIGWATVSRDITEHRRIEEALRESEEMFATAFRSSPTGIALMTSSGQYVRVNPAFGSMLGYETEEMIGQTAVSLGIVTAQERTRILSEFDRLNKPLETTIRRRDGSFLDVLFANAITTLSGVPHLLGTIIDITERKQAQQNLIDSERRYRSLFENMNSGFALYEVIQDDQGVPVDLVILAANAIFEQTTGLNIQGVIGKRLTHVLPGIEKDAADWIGTFGRVALTGEARQFEQISERLGTYYSITAYQSGPKQCAVAFLDITERKQAETALRESEAAVRNKLKAILEPEGDLGVLQLADIIDVPSLQSMLESFYQATGLLSGVVDNHGRVLVRAGWQDICEKFHRRNPETLKHCIESDTILAQGATPGTFKTYCCKNSMRDMASPIEVSGQHLGNIYFGQFFYADEEPDVGLFREQARRHGFDETEYLAALSRVPRFSRKTVKEVMDFYSKLAEMISSLSFSNIRLARTLTERKQAEFQLRRMNRFYTALSETNQMIVRVGNVETLFQRTCEIVVEYIGFRLAWIGMPDGDRFRVVAAAGAATEYLDDIRISPKADLPEGDGPSGRAFRSGTHDVCNDFLHERRTRLWADQAGRFGIQAAAVFPLRKMGEIIGVLNVYADEVNAFHEQEIHLLDEMATDISFALDHLQQRVDLQANVADLRQIREELELRVQQRTAQLEQAKTRAEAADRVKSAFLATMSHEFRTPLNSIIGFTGILLQRLAGPLSGDQTKQLTIIKNAGQHLLSLVNDVLDISKIEAGELRIDIEPVDLPKLLQRTADKFRVEATMQGLKFTLDVEPGIGMVNSNERRLEQVLNNFIANALKFTDHGEIRLICQQEGENVRIEVRDTGIGIAGDDIAKLFKPFSQLEARPMRVAKGTGLGLAICRRIVEALGGEIGVTSTLGVGSCFYCTLPVLGKPS